MPVGIQVFDTSGTLVFDSNNHRLIKLERQLTNLVWNAIGTTQTVWEAKLFQVSVQILTWYLLIQVDIIL